MADKISGYYQRHTFNYGDFSTHTQNIREKKKGEKHESLGNVLAFRDDIGEVEESSVFIV